MKVTLKGPSGLNKSFNVDGETFTFSDGVLDKEIEHSLIPLSLWGYGVEIVAQTSKKLAAEKKD